MWPPSGWPHWPRPGSACDAATGQDLYEWLLKWFNPNLRLPAAIPTSCWRSPPIPGDEDLPFGHDLAERLTLTMPRSDNASATWWFDDLPHTLVTVQGLRRAPEVGHMTAERQAGDHVFSLFDRFPEHTVMVLTLTVRPQDFTRNHIAQVKRAAVGDSAEAELTREDAEAVEREMARGNKLYPLGMAFYVRGDDLKSLRANVNQLNALLLPNGLQPILHEADLLALDSYLRNLPMAYDVSLDKSSRRSRLVFSSHTANLLPLYGRSKRHGPSGPGVLQPGCRTPGVRSPASGRPQKERPHAHPGPHRRRQVGACWSTCCNRWPPCTARASSSSRPAVPFRCWASSSRPMALAVNQVTLNPNTDVSLPPFADALRVLQKERQHHLREDPDALAMTTMKDEEGTGRDVLGEMEIAARIMITGGDEREDARMTRADRLLIRNAIFLAAQTVKESRPGSGAHRGRGGRAPSHRSGRVCRITGATGPSRWATAWRFSAPVLPGISSTDPVPPGRRPT